MNYTNMLTELEQPSKSKKNPDISKKNENNTL